MSRLDYAPPKKADIKITDLTRGLGEFPPRPEKSVARDALAATLKKAGYTLAEAWLVAQGTVEREGQSWYLRIPESKQRLELRGFANLQEGANQTLEGRWAVEKGEVLFAK